ncbi:hypothetical protein RhiLY_06308 [Ceratobasidium sp. AG-Ba]|nr:hypothetical protein RhiLY_06308 [Ceratobasidium sp. AG-Ba]
MSAELVANMGLAVIEDDVAAVGYYVDLESNKRYLGKILARVCMETKIRLEPWAKRSEHADNWFHTTEKKKTRGRLSSRGQFFQIVYKTRGRRCTSQWGTCGELCAGRTRLNVELRRALVQRRTGESSKGPSHRSYGTNGNRAGPRNRHRPLRIRDGHPLAVASSSLLGRPSVQSARTGVSSPGGANGVQPAQHGTALANTDVSVRFIPNPRRPARFPIPNKPAIISGSASRRAEPRARTTCHPCAQRALEAEFQLMPRMGEPNIVRRSPTPKNTAD